MSVIKDMSQEASASSRPSRAFVFVWPAKSYAVKAPPPCAPRAAGTVIKTRPKFGCPEHVHGNETKKPKPISSIGLLREMSPLTAEETADREARKKRYFRNYYERTRPPGWAPKGAKPPRPVFVPQTPEQRGASRKASQRKRGDKLKGLRRENPAAFKKTEEQRRRHVEMSARWQRENREIVAARTAARRIKVAKSARSDIERTDIEALYRDASSLGMHVDHIVPINHPDVCGLHRLCNLQLLTPADNMAKGNKFTSYSFTN